MIYFNLIVYTHPLNLKFALDVLGHMDSLLDHESFILTTNFVTKKCHALPSIWIGESFLLFEMNEIAEK